MEINIKGITDIENDYKNKKFTTVILKCCIQQLKTYVMLFVKYQQPSSHWTSEFSQDIKKGAKFQTLFKANFG